MLDGGRQISEKNYGYFAKLIPTYEEITCMSDYDITTKMYHKSQTKSPLQKRTAQINLHFRKYTKLH